MRFNRLLYFSLDQECCKSFVQYVKLARLDAKYSFRILEHESIRDGYRHPSDLLFLLDKTEDHGEEDGQLFVIIDYTSLCVQQSKEWHDSFERVQDLIQRAILKYPDVYFMFDESCQNNQNNQKKSFDYRDFLFLGADPTFREEVFQSYHSFNINGDNPFFAVCDGRDNLFDGSGLRNAVKQFLYDKLNVKKRNFDKIQKSRSDNLALCVEEEHSQCRFNSYALFIQGYRSLPVSSSKELKRLNNLEIKPKLVVRDYDLQFSDIEDHSVEVDVGNEKIIFRTIDEIRGSKYIDETSSFFTGYWLVKDIKRNGYWSAIMSNSTVVRFITNGHRDDAFYLKTGAVESFLRYKANTSLPNSEYKVFPRDAAVLNGISKPVTGLYYPFNKVLGLGLEIDEESPIDTRRMNHDHGLPLDLYDLASGMVDRAQRFFHMRRFIRSAVIATEAMEVMNGFHQALMLRAYHIKAVSENAIAMNVIGASEQDLKLDTDMRIQIYSKFVNRMLARPNETRDGRDIEEHSALRRNVLNQIFSDCRSFCREKEQFKSEEAFIAAMARLNDGLTVADVWNKMKHLVISIKKRIHEKD